MMRRCECPTSGTPVRSERRRNNRIANSSNAMPYSLKMLRIIRYEKFTRTFSIYTYIYPAVHKYSNRSSRGSRLSSSKEISHEIQQAQDLSGPGSRRRGHGRIGGDGRRPGDSGRRLVARRTDDRRRVAGVR
ncbi:hypothetical protein BVI1335_2160008 [Burkholderia vietnamiensis]|nr:hypothetical protein BVI1335_2160008 [Burkholderia vietnamiensis]